MSDNENESDILQSSEDDSIIDSSLFNTNIETEADTKQKVKRCKRGSSKLSKNTRCGTKKTCTTAASSANKPRQSISKSKKKRKVREDPKTVIQNLKNELRKAQKK